MFIQKEGRKFVAHAQGLVGEGRTHYGAICALLREIWEMRRLETFYGLSDQTSDSYESL